MQFEAPLIPGTLIKRYKRFLADIRLENGQEITAHCANPGSMLSCNTPGWPVMLSYSDNPKRKLPYTLEMIHNGSCWIGVNTLRPNQVIKAALEQGDIPELQGYQTIRAEVKYGENSRIDFLLESPEQRCYLEVKGVSLLLNGVYQFPDGVSSRGRKHLYELAAMAKAGQRAVNFFLVMRGDADVFQPAWEIDPDYARALAEVAAQGVELLAYQAEISPTEIKLGKKIPVVLD